LKRSAAKALTQIIDAIGPNFKVHVPQMLPILVESLSGRTWQGKEAVLGAFYAMIANSGDYFDLHPSRPIVEIFLRECKKNDIEYKRHALEYFEKAMASLKVDCFEEVKDFLMDILSNNDMDIDQDERNAKPISILVQVNACKLLGTCFKSDCDGSSQVIKSMCTNLKHNVWNVKLAILKSLAQIINVKNTSIGDTDNLIASLGVCLKDGKVRSLNLVFGCAETSP
jgi:proteasome component ECM29